MKNYAVKDRALNLKELGQSVGAAVARFREEFPGIRIMIETGRHVVGKAGVYAAVLSPVQFSTQIWPIELFLNEDGSVVEESFTSKLEESLSGQEP